MVTCCNGLAVSAYSPFPFELCDLTLTELLWLLPLPIALHSSKTSAKVFAMAADRHCSPNASWGKVYGIAQPFG